MSAEVYGEGPRPVAAGDGPKGVLDRVVHLLLPAPCLACGRPLPAAGGRLGLCAGCRGRLVALPPGCAICARPLAGVRPAASGALAGACGSCLVRPPAFDRLLACWSYEDPVDAVVRGLKFRRLDYLGDHLAAALAPLLAGALGPRLAGLELVVPAPLHWRRRLARGFDQADRIARPLARRLGLPILPALVRRRATPPQTGLGRDERLANLRRAFRPRTRAAARVAGRRVLLVDDVATTGATLDAAAAALKRAGAAEVVAAVAARTPEP